MNLAKYIDKDPPMASDGKSLLDYLAYLKEQINFLFHNWSRSIRETKATVDEMVSNGTIQQLGNNTVILSNGLTIAKGRNDSASLVSTSGTQIGTSGLYRYEIKLTSSATNFISTPQERPVEMADVYSNSLGVSIPASCRAEGTAGAWTTHRVTFYWPASTLSGTFAVERIIVLKN